MSLNINAGVVENKPKYVNESGGSKLTYNFVTDPRLKRGHNFGIIYVTSSNYEDNSSSGPNQKKSTPGYNEGGAYADGAGKKKGKGFTGGTKEKEERAKKYEHEGIGVYTEKVITTVRPRPITFEEIIQTDPLPPTPQEPLIWPKKTGIDVETQIGDTDLFNFDEEVKPLVHIIVSKTLEEGRREVLEEEELKHIKEQQEMYKRFNKANDERIKKIEEAERKRFDSHLRRKNNKKQRIELTRMFQRKLQARVKAKKYISNLRDDAYKALGDKKIFKNKDDNYYFTDLLPELHGLAEEYSKNDYLIVNKLKEMFTKKKYNNDCKKHAESITNEKNRLAENERIRNIIHEREEEEKRKKKEERARKKHEKILNGLRQSIQEDLLTSSEWVEENLENIFNINGYYQKTKNVTLVGGPIGQIALILNYLNKLIPDFLTDDKVPKLLDVFLEKSHPFYFLWNKEDLEGYKAINENIETIEDIIKADEKNYKKIIEQFFNNSLNNDDMLQIFFDVCKELGLEKVKDTYISVFSTLLERFKEGSDFGQVRFLEKTNDDEEIPLLCICLLSPEVIPLDNAVTDQGKNRGKKKFSYESFFYEKTFLMPTISDKIKIININKNFDKNYRNNLIECIDILYELEDKLQSIEDINNEYENFIKCLLIKLSEKYKKEIVEMAVGLHKDEEEELNETEKKQKTDENEEES